MSGRQEAGAPTAARRKLGAIVGLVAFGTGAFSTSMLADGIDRHPMRLFEATDAESAQVVNQLLPVFTEEPSSLQVASWVYHRAHFAPIEAEFAFQDQSVPIEFALEPSGVVTFLPAVVLAVAGYLVAARVPTSSSEDAAKAGAHVVIGYVVGTIASVYLLSADIQGQLDVDGAAGDVSLDGTLTAGPELVDAVLYTGLAFPLVLGALGGYLAHDEPSERAPTETEQPGESARSASETRQDTEPR